MLNLLAPSQPINKNHHNDSLVKPQKQQQQPLAKEVLIAPLNVEGSEGSDTLALFHRHEIKVGALVGSGSFSEVFEITGFELPSKNNTNKKSKRRNSKSSNLEDSLTMLEPSRRRKRQDLMDSQQQHLQDVCSGKALKSRYVLKQLHAKLLSDPKLFRRALKDLATEVSIMSSIDHPHIARLHATAAGGTNAMAKEGSGQHDAYFLVLDRLVETLDARIESWNQEKLLAGPSYYLDSATNNEKIALKANYALQIASALDYLHQRRIVFRDLKPQNIGFKEVHPNHPERDVLCLFDFGLSRHLPSPDKANADGLYKMSMVGTRRYMAPEVVITKHYNDKADTFSWSLVFYELITQVRPFDGIQRAEHKQYICMDGKRPKIYSYYGFPPELERLLRFAWAQDVSKRLTMHQVVDTLKSYLKGTIHEHCVHEPVVDNNNKPAVIHDDSIASLLSYNTQQTDGTVSTTNSDGPLDDRPSEAVVVETSVPQAIAVASVTAGSSTASEEQDDDDQVLEPPRRVSFCERCTNAFRSSFSRMFR